MILVFIKLPVFSESSSHWTTLCGFTGLYSSSAVGLDLGTGSRVVRASGAQEQMYTTQEQSVKAPTRGQQEGWMETAVGLVGQEQRGKEGGGGGRGFLENP